jgi:hypothetical protein
MTPERPTNLAVGVNCENGSFVLYADSEQPQHLAALNSANTIRLAIAGEKKRIKQLSRRDGFLRAADLIASNPDLVNRIEMWALLITIRRYGPHQASEFLANRRIGEKRRVCDLTDRQRRELARLLRDKAAA